MALLALAYQSHATEREGEGKIESASGGREREGERRVVERVVGESNGKKENGEDWLVMVGGGVKRS